MANVTDILLRLVVENQSAIKNTKDFQDSQKNLSKEVQNNTVVFVQNTNAIKSYEKSLGLADESINDLSKTTKENSKIQLNWNEIIKTGASVTSDFVSTLANVIGNFGVVGFIRESSSALFDFGKNATIAATATTALSAYLGNNFINSFKSVNSAMANVNSVLLESSGGIENLTDKVADLSTSFKLATQTQIAEGLYDVASAGFTGAEGLKVMESAVKASVAGLTDVKTAATPLVQVLNATGQSAENSEKIMDSMFMTVQRGVLTFRDYGNGIGRVIGTAQSLGVSLATLNGGIALLTKMGSMPEAAFTNMNSLLLSFSAMSETAKAKAKELGIQMDANAVKAKGFEVVVAEMVKAAEKTGDLNGTLFTLLGRQEALDAAIKLSTQSGNLYRKEVEANINSNNAMSKSLEKQTKSYEMQEKAISVGMDNIKKSIGKVVSQWVGSLFPTFQKAIDYFNNLDKTSKTVIITLGFIPPILGSIVAAIGLVTFGLIAFAAQITLSSLALNIIRTNLGVVTGYLNTFAGGALTATRSMWGFAAGTTAGNTALTGLKATLLTTVGTLTGFFAVFAAGAIAIGLVTKAVLDMRTAFKEEENMEAEQAETANKNATRLKVLREADIALRKEGKHLTAQEAQEYARLLSIVTNGHKIGKAAAAEKMKDSKAYLKQEEEIARREKPLTAEQLKARKEFLEKVKDAELKAANDKYAMAVNEAKKAKDEALTELNSNINLGIVKEKESIAIKKSINDTFNSSIKKASIDRDKEILQKQKESTDKYISDINKRFKLPLIKSEQKILDIESSKLSEEDKVKRVNKELLIQKNIYAIKLSYFQKDTDAYIDNEIKIKEIQRRISKNNSDLVKSKLEKEQEQAKLVQKINDDILEYVKDETKKRQEQEKKDLELQKQEFEKNLDLRVKAYKDYLKKLGDAEKQKRDSVDTAIKLGYQDEINNLQKSREDADFKFSIGEISLEKRNEILKQSREQEALNYDSIVENFELSEDKKTEYQNKALKLRRDNQLDDYNQQKNFQDNFISSTLSSLTSLGQSLESSNNELVNNFGKLSNFAGQSFNQIKESMTSTDGAVQVAISNITKSLESMFLNFDKQNKSFDTYNQAVAQFGKDSQEAKDAILTVNEGISDSFKALPGIIGEPLAQLTRMFTDFIGLTESAAEKTKKALDTANFKKLLSEFISITNNALSIADQETQLNIDLIEDERQRKEAQLEFDINMVKKSGDLESIKTAKIKKIRLEYDNWLEDYNADLNKKELDAQKDLDDKQAKLNEDNIKKIRDTNEANYKSELSIIDKFYGEKRRKLEQDVQKEIDIIQAKNDRLKAIDDERNQTDADKKKRLQSFNQSLASSNRTADFYRSNVEDFEVGFGGISNQRKQLEADYQAGNINYETYAKKRTEIGLKQFQYYTEQSKRISDPKEKQEAIDKATQGQQEYYDFIFDKEKEKVENETRQAQIRLDSKRIELAKITEIEKQEIAKLDQAYKDSSGLYKDSFVTATQVWVKFAQDSINDIDLSNLINKVKNDINQAKQELGLVSAKTGTGTTNTPVTTSKSGYSTGGQVGPLLPDGAFYSKDSSFGKSLQTTNTSQIRPMREKSEQQKKNELISKLVVNPMFGYSFDNYINQSLSWLENQAIRLGIPLMKDGGVTKGLSIAGEVESEAIYNYSQMKDMYDFVKKTTSNSNSNYNSNSNSINIFYNPVFTGVDLAKSGQVDNMIKSNFDSLKRDIIKASGGR